VRKLKKAMAEKNCDAAMLAALTGLSKLAIEQLLAGESGGRVTSLVKIADALGVRDLNSLFDRLE
jgi:transcriptional regulator with XRE-family HTH domain